MDISFGKPQNVICFQDRSQNESQNFLFGLGSSVSSLPRKATHRCWLVTSRGSQPAVRGGGDSGPPAVLHVRPRSSLPHERLWWLWSASGALLELAVTCMVVILVISGQPTDKSAAIPSSVSRLFDSGSSSLDAYLAYCDLISFIIQTWAL